MKLCWNAIVKNESAIIERCVNSLLSHVDCAIVVDTGSVDGTADLIKYMFDVAGKPAEIMYTAFVNFEQARNHALRTARESQLDWDYLLLADADMELKVKQPFQLNGGLAYDMKQVAGSLSYWNRRLVSRQATGQFIGVTHEFLDIPADGVIDTAEFIDHADGSNRADKFSRDIALLTAALKTETRPGLIQRYTFYLAGTYWDIGDWDSAALRYSMRAIMGGFDEEAWYAQMRYAMCLERLNDGCYLREMLKAYEMRPTRAETLYELAKHFRLQGDDNTSLLFSEAGMELRHPKTDLLFVNDWVYTNGLREEYAICGYYSDEHRKRAAMVCNKLALSGSGQARSNQYWYLRPLGDSVPSFTPKQIEFTPPAGYVANNPSVINCVTCGGKPLYLVRTVNYTITPEGRYAIQGTDGSVSADNPIHTRNFLVSATGQFELNMPDAWPEAKYHLVRGFEDSRLFYWDNKLWTLSTVRELNVEGVCEQVLTSLRASLPSNKWAYSDDWIKILPKERQHEKNWMPWVIGDELRFVYRLGTLVDLHGEVIFHDDPGFDVSNISGGSQVVQVDERTWVGLVHEARTIPGKPGNRYYQHRFVSFRTNGKVDRISPPFYFHGKQIEFTAGLAFFAEKKQLMVSYGVRDCEAWTATMDADEVVRFIYKDTQ